MGLGPLGSHSKGEVLNGRDTNILTSNVPGVSLTYIPAAGPLFRVRSKRELQLVRRFLVNF